MSDKSETKTEAESRTDAQPVRTTQLDNTRAELVALGERANHKWLSPWTVGRIFDEARTAAESIARNVDRYEGMTPAQLLRAAPEIHGLHGKIAPRFLFGCPDGLPHEPQVVAYRDWDWEQQEGTAAQKAFMNIVTGIPSDGYARFAAIVAALPTIEIQQDAISANARRGGKAKLVKDAGAAAKAVAKAAAMDLWPYASRKGLTAVQFHTQLTKQGHSVAPDTARKWLTALRKTGTC